MNMQQMRAQAQKMKRESEKAQAALAEQEFSVSKGGAVTVIMLGNKTRKNIDIEKDALDPENKELIQDMIALAINELFEQINAAEEEINERITGSARGFGF